jgi:hypothetical protein
MDGADNFTDAAHDFLNAVHGLGRVIRFSLKPKLNSLRAYSTVTLLARLRG